MELEQQLMWLNSMLNFLHTYLPQPILFTLGNVSVHWYGLILAIAVLLGYWLVIKMAKQRSLEIDLVSNIYLNLLIWGFIGARLYHILNEWSYYNSHLTETIAVWKGGLAIHGAIIAGILVVYYYSRLRKVNFWLLADLYSLPLILGQALGRWGNYFNQELFGRPTNLAWGIPIETSNRPFGFIDNIYFHPTFLYESIWNFVVLGLLYFIWRKNKNKPGLVFWAYIILYSLGRLVVESFRIDRTPLIFGWRLPLLISAGLFVVGSMSLFLFLLRTKKK